MQFLRSPSKCGGCGLPVPAAAASPFGRDGLCGNGCPRGPDSRPCGRRHTPGDVPPAAARCLAPRQSALRPAVARSPAKSLKVRGDRLPSCSVRPHRREIGDMANGASERCIFPARRRGDAQRRHFDAVFRVRDRVAPVDAALLRQTPGCPGAPDLRRTSGVPPGNVAHGSDRQAGRTLLPSSALHQHNLLSSPCRRRLRGGLSSTSLPESRPGSESIASLFRPSATVPRNDVLPLISPR